MMEQKEAILETRYSRIGLVEQLVAPVSLKETPCGLVTETDYKNARWQTVRQEKTSLAELNKMLVSMKELVNQHQLLMGPSKFNEGKIDCLEQILNYLNKPIYRNQ